MLPLGSGSETRARQEEPEETRYRQPKRVLAKVLTVVAVGFTLFFALYNTGIASQIGYIPGAAVRPVFLGICLLLVLLLVPATKEASKRGVPWYDAALALLSLAAVSYLIINWYKIQFSYFASSPIEQVLGTILIIAIVEGTRRCYGWFLALLPVLFLIYMHFANFFPGLLQARGYSWSRIIGYVYLSPNDSATGQITGIVATVIVAFVFFSRALLVSGTGKFIIDLAFALAGHIRGGPAKVAVISSGLFGTVSGSSVANVAAVGSFTIPTMIKIGYKPHFAAAIEAAASTGGQIMPPVMGSAAFIMAEYLGVSYLTVCAAALVPAILYYFAIFLMVDMEAAKSGMSGLPREGLPSLRKTLKEGWQYVVPIFALLFLMLVLEYTPQRAAYYSVGLMIIVSMVRKETMLGPKKLIHMLEGGARGIMELGVAVGAVAIIMSVISVTGLGVRMSALLLELSMGILPLLAILTAITCLILGLALPTVACYILLAVTVAPALVRMGVEPMAAHLFIFYFGIISVITPPDALAAYTAAAIAHSPPMRTGFQAMLLGMVAFIVPFVFIYHPALVMVGDPGEIALTAVTALVGIAALSYGVGGYLLKPLAWLQRVLLIGSGLMMMFGSWLIHFTAIGIMGGVVAWLIIEARAARLAVAAKEKSSEQPIVKPGTQ